MFSVFAHTVLFTSKSRIHTWIVLIGLLTSLLNHGTKNKTFKKIDRLFMKIAFASDMYFLPVRMHVVLAGIAYYISKIIQPREYFHVLAHALVTSGHLQLTKL